MNVPSAVRRRIAVIGAPSSAGAYAPGQELAPAALRDAGLIESLQRLGREIEDLGDLPCFRWRVDLDSPRARNPGAVVAMIEAVRDEATAALATGASVLVLGGDCTIGFGLDRCDGHCRRRECRSGLSRPSCRHERTCECHRWSTGLDGLGHALDLPGALPELARTCRLTNAQVVLCGYSAQHATEHEHAHIARLDVNVVTAKQIVADPAAAARAALAALGSRSSLAVHFDVDLVDFGQVPLSEHTGANQGIGFVPALRALTELLVDPRVRIVTVTEHNPLHGAPDGSDTRRLADALADACATL